MSSHFVRSCSAIILQIRPRRCESNAVGMCVVGVATVCDDTGVSVATNMPVCVIDKACMNLCEGWIGAGGRAKYMSSCGVGWWKKGTSLLRVAAAGVGSMERMVALLSASCDLRRLASVAKPLTLHGFECRLCMLLPLTGRPSAADERSVHWGAALACCSRYGAAIPPAVVILLSG